jgi:dTDP-4-amino-4,6-dideoxygalactose transaminase
VDPTSEIPFNLPFATGDEFAMIREAIDNMHLSGNGPFSRRCEAWLAARIGSAAVHLAPSCTAALEMATLLAGIEPGDEVLMPSFTFVSTANAVVLRGATPVFVDIRPDTLNLDEELLEAAVTEHTKAIVPVHYGGVACDMDVIMSVADRHGLIVIEDAAHALLARYQERPLGGIGQLGALSFHETKNVICGEGGALLVNDPALVERAEIVQEKGTDRRQFFRGEVDKYTWVEVGSSFLLSDVNAAFLYAQLQQADAITRRRMELWTRYHEGFRGLESQGVLRRPIVPHDVEHSAHLYYLLIEPPADRDDLIAALERQGIGAVFHYVPLHSAPAGRRYGREGSEMSVTEDVSARLVRLPLWIGMEESHVDRVVDAVARCLTRAPSYQGVGRAAAAALGKAREGSPGPAPGTDGSS